MPEFDGRGVTLQYVSIHKHYSIQNIAQIDWDTQKAEAVLLHIYCLVHTTACMTCIFSQLDDCHNMINYLAIMVGYIQQPLPHILAY